VSPARILVVDDELSLLKTFPRLLRPHIVELASSGALALARLATLPAFDVVLCDLHLDDLDGRDLYLQACACSPELRLRFVFMTGDRGTSPPGLEHDTHAARVLSKPFDRAALHGAIDDTLRRLPPRTEHRGEL
jgi:two-component system response regulator MprA